MSSVTVKHKRHKYININYQYHDTDYKSAGILHHLLHLLDEIALLGLQMR